MTQSKSMFGTTCLSAIATLSMRVAAIADTSVALVLPGSIGDGGWNQGAYVGLSGLDEAEFDVAYSENVSQADIPSVVQGDADDGYDLIIGHGFQFGSLMAELAPDYPDQAFFATTSAPGDTDVPSNVLYLDYRYPDLGYAVGALAALMSDSGVIGVVGGGDNPNTQNMATSFASGAAVTVEGTKAIGMFSDQTEQAPEIIATSLNPNTAGIVQAVSQMVAGSVTVNGREVSVASCLQRRQIGIGYVPPDRRGVGSLVSLSIEDNFLLGSGNTFSRRGLIDRSALRNAGVPILLASTEPEEVLALSDGVAVMFEGQIMGIVPRAEATTDVLGAMMVGTPLDALRQRQIAS